MARTPSPLTGQPGEERPVGSSRRATTVFHVVVLVSGVSFGLTGPFTALLALQLGGSQAAAAMVVSSMGIALLFVDVVAARWMAGLGTGAVLGGSALIFGLGSLCAVAAPSWQLLALARVVQGLGAAMFMSGGVNLAVRLRAGRSRSRAIGTFNAAWFAGIAVGPLGGGLIASSLPGIGGLRVLFALSAGVCLVSAVLGRWVAPQAPAGVAARLGLPRGLGVRGRRLWAVMALAVVGQAVRGGVAMTLVPLVSADASMSWAWAGVVLFALAVTDIAAMQAGPRIADRYGPAVVLAVGLALGALSCVLLGTGSPRPAAVIGYALILGVSVGLAWIIPATMSVDLLDSSADALTAYRISCDVGLLVGGALTASGLLFGGLRATLLGSAAVVVASLVAVALAGDTRSHRTHPRGGTHALPID